MAATQNVNLEISNNIETQVELIDCPATVSSIEEDIIEHAVPSTTQEESPCIDKTVPDNENNQLIQEKKNAAEIDIPKNPLNTNDVIQEETPTTHKLESETSTVEEEKITVPSTDSENIEKISIFNIKWVEYNHKNLPVVTQNENGSCPLLAIINYLLLKEKISFPANKTIVESPELTSLLANYILEHVFNRVEPSLRENLEQQVNDAISMIPYLVRGLDVNIRFTGIRDFEYTSDIEIFNLLGIPLYHGWLLEPELTLAREVIKDNSYNQLVVKIVQQRSSDNENLLREALIAEEFLNNTASQLTYHGLCELSSALESREMGVLFRNNHFHTILKHIDSLYVLVTDQGFLNESGVVWESLTNIEGDSFFLDSNFKIYRPSSDAVNTKNQNVIASSSSDSQINNDYLMALTLQQDEDKNRPHSSTLNDEELARSLQLAEEETLSDDEENKKPRKVDATEVTKQKRYKSDATTSSHITSQSSPSVFRSIKDNCTVM